MSAALIQNIIGTALPRVDHAEGVWVVDALGNRYLDGCSGAMAVNLGHSHPRIIDAMREQAGKVTFTHRGAFESAALVSLADRLTSATGYAGAWFVDSGSEAIESAMQFAIQYHRENGQDRSWFLSHARSYHGNTLGALSLSGHARRAGFGGLALDFPQLPSPFPTPGAPTAEDADALLGQAERIIADHAEVLAGVVFEPVGGATLGAAIPNTTYLRGLEQICARHGVLLIADEVMTGLGRTGRLLAIEHHGVSPDLVALGKGVAAGYSPIAATLVSARVLSALESGSGRSPGGHTYGGNPFSAAVASAVLDVILDEGIVGRAERTGAHLGERLDDLARAYPVIIEARGKGMLRALELSPVNGPGPSIPGVRAARLAQTALEEKLIIYPATGGFNDACIIAPPLTSTTAEIDELIARLARALARIDGSV